jgi:hypothetical protein
LIHFTKKRYLLEIIGKTKCKLLKNTQLTYEIFDYDHVFD